jgi:cysteinyl-tRNA synthetase
VHNGFVTVDDEKMSKSLGNFFTIKDVLAKYDPMTVRYFLLSQHYRSPLNFSDKALDVAAATWSHRIMGAYRIAKEWAGQSSAPADVSEFRAALANDLNTPDALAELNNFCSRVYEADKARAPIANAQLALDAMFDALGLVPVVEESWSQEILDLAKQRQEARAAKEWKRSDEIRDALKAKGVVIEDTPAGPRLKRI